MTGHISFYSAIIAFMPSLKIRVLWCCMCWSLWKCINSKLKQYLRKKRDLIINCLQKRGRRGQHPQQLCRKARALKSGQEAIAGCVHVMEVWPREGSAGCLCSGNHRNGQKRVREEAGRPSRPCPFSGEDGWYPWHHGRADPACSSVCTFSEDPSPHLTWTWATQYNLTLLLLWVCVVAGLEPVSFRGLLWPKWFSNNLFLSFLVLSV